MMCCGGVMPFYEYEHIPGIDWLGRYCDMNLSSRQVLSVARQLGKEKILCEMFAATGWDVSPRELKNLTEMMFINGINIPTQYCPPHNVYNINAIDTQGFASILVNRLGEIYVNHIQKSDTETSVEVSWIDGYIDYWLETKEETNDE